VFEAIKQIGRKQDGTLAFPSSKTADGGKLAKLCLKAAKQLQRLNKIKRRDGPGRLATADTELLETPVESLVPLKEIFEAANRLQVHTTEPNQTDKMHDSLAIAVRALAILLRALLRLEDGDEIARAHLSLMHDIITTICGLYDGASLYRKDLSQKKTSKGMYRDELTSANVLGHVRSINASLRKVEARFGAVLRAIKHKEEKERKAEEKRRRDALHWEQNRAIREQQERETLREAEIQLAIDQRDQHWAKLHEHRYRIAMEGRIGLPERVTRHLAMPSLPDIPRHEVDANGEPFEREEVFNPRQSRPPGSKSVQNCMPWSDKTVEVLAYALRDFSDGPIYEAIIRELCPRVYGNERPNRQHHPDRGALADYNVTEIVEKAMELKRNLLNDCEVYDDEVEPWMTKIYDPRIVNIPPPRPVEEWQEVRADINNIIAESGEMACAQTTANESATNGMAGVDEGDDTDANHEVLDESQQAEDDIAAPGPREPPSTEQDAGQEDSEIDDSDVDDIDEHEGEIEGLLVEAA